MANTAVDERFAMFYSTVIVASAREAVSMVDMYSGGVPLNNPIIKSTIHSTEVVFGMMVAIPLLGLM